MNILIKSVKERIQRCCGSIRFNHTSGPKTHLPRGGNNVGKGEKMHPYCRIHLWKSKEKFIDDILNHVIFDKNGLVAVNKPYGISVRPKDPTVVRKKNLHSGIPFEVNYTLTDALPFIAKKLGYESLTIAKTPERFTTGIVLLSANDEITQAIAKSLRRADGSRVIPRSYWIVTRGIPIHDYGEWRVAIKPINDPNSDSSEPHIVTSWSENERSRGDIKILNLQFQVLSTSMNNLASLLEIKSSTNQWHAIRLFAATMLMSPVLGDRVYGSRVQSVMGKFININAFVDAAHALPIIDERLLHFLKLPIHKTMLIPAHVHLREIYLPGFQRRGNNITIVASPQTEFLWTCRQLNLNEKLLEPAMRN